MLIGESDRGNLAESKAAGRVQQRRRTRQHCWPSAPPGCSRDPVPTLSGKLNLYSRIKDELRSNA